jgi:hypothetical protein
MLPGASRDAMCWLLLHFGDVSVHVRTCVVVVGGSDNMVPYPMHVLGLSLALSCRSRSCCWCHETICTQMGLWWFLELQ